MTPAWKSPTLQHNVLNGGEEVQLSHLLLWASQVSFYLYTHQFIENKGSKT